MDAQIGGCMDLATGHIRNGFGRVIGDSVVSMALGEDFPPGNAHSLVDLRLRRGFGRGLCARPAVGRDVDLRPADKPYHERQAGVRDAFGNVWYIATYVGGA